MLLPLLLVCAQDMAKSAIYAMRVSYGSAATHDANVPRLSVQRIRFRRERGHVIRHQPRMARC